MYVTTQLLRKAGACSDDLKRYRKRFGDGYVEITLERVRWARKRNHNWLCFIWWNLFHEDVQHKYGACCCTGLTKRFMDAVREQDKRNTK